LTSLPALPSSPLSAVQDYNPASTVVLKALILLDRSQNSHKSEIIKALLVRMVDKHVILLLKFPDQPLFYQLSNHKFASSNYLKPQQP
jgi:hypothetical protein